MLLGFGDFQARQPAFTTINAWPSAWRLHFLQTFVPWLGKSARGQPLAASSASRAVGSSASSGLRHPSSGPGRGSPRRPTPAVARPISTPSQPPSRGFVSWPSSSLDSLNNGFRRLPQARSGRPGAALPAKRAWWGVGIGGRRGRRIVEKCESGWRGVFLCRAGRKGKPRIVTSSPARAQPPESQHLPSLANSETEETEELQMTQRKHVGRAPTQPLYLFPLPTRHSWR